MKKFVAKIGDDDFSKYPKLDLKLIDDMDTVLSNDVPGLMAQFPSEREDEYRSLVSSCAVACPGEQWPALIPQSDGHMWPGFGKLFWPLQFDGRPRPCYAQPRWSANMSKCIEHPSGQRGSCS